MSPLTPCGRRMTPTSSKPAGVVRRSVIDEVDVDLDTVARRGRPNDGADALGGAAPTSDNPAEVARTDLDLQLDATPGRHRLDADGVDVIDDRADHVGQHSGGRRSVERVGCIDVVARVAHLAAARAASNSPHAPEI